MNFALKLSLKIFIVGIIILSIALIIFYNNSYKNTLNNEVKHSQDIVQELSISIDQNILEKLKTTKAIAVAPIMEKVLNESNTHYSSLSNQLRSDEIKSQNEKWIAIKDHNDSFIRKFTDNSISQYFKNLQNNLKGEYGEIFLTNKYGALVASTAKLTTFAHGHKYWWKGAYDNESVFFDDRGYDESVGGYVLGIVIPIKDGNEIIGILKANLNILGSISKIITNTQSPHVGELKLIRSGGLIIFEKGIEPLSKRIPSGISEKIKFDKESSFIFKEQDNEWIIGLAEIELTSNIEGFHFGGSFESIDHKKGNTGESWYLINYRPKEIIKNAIQSDLNKLLIVGFLLLVFLAITALIIGIQTANPLKKLMRQANKIAKGDFDSKVLVKRNDEIGLLATSFNKMIKNLKHTTTSIDKLKDEIEEREKAQKNLLYSTQQLSESKEKYQTLFDNMLDSFALYEIVLDKDNVPIDYIFIEINDAFEQQTGLLREKIIGEKVTEVLPGIENDATGWIEIYGKVALTGEGVKFESFSEPMDQWYFINAYSPKKGYFATVFEDITERKQAETEIKKLSAAVEQSANTIVISDIEGNIEYVNPVFTKLTGYSAKEALGQNPRILNAGTQAKEYYAEMWQTISAGKIWEGEFHNKTKNGNFFWEHVIITPLKNDAGVITNYLAVKENITDRKKAELKLKESEEQLRELNTTKDKFFSIIAHDLRSPFNSILGFSELILENSKSNDFSNMLKMSTILNDTVNKSFDLLNNLLEWSRVQTDRITFMPNNHQLSILIVEVIKLLSLAAMKKNIKVDFEVSDIEIKIDVNMIQTVLRNLLSNAIKYSHKGGLINISAFENKNEVEISVKDNGVGINKEYMGKLFLLGENITTLGTDNEKGTGLGLILCKEFVEKHKGKIWLESEEGKGSEFKFILPKKM